MNADFTPTLTFVDPPEFYRGAGNTPREYSSIQVNAGFEVYAFREVEGDAGARFRQGLADDWVDPRHRGGHRLGAPAFTTQSAPGADVVIVARYQDTIVGLPNERARVLVIAGRFAALIDIHANSAACWLTISPALERMFGTLRVERQTTPSFPTEGPGPDGVALAGLYVSTKSKYVPDLSRPVGFGRHVPSLHYYLFSADGRVHCCYDFPPGPGGDWRRFDLRAALRDDPVNTGNFVVRNGVMHLRFNGQPPESFDAELRPDGALVIQGCVYFRQR